MKNEKFYSSRFWLLALLLLIALMVRGLYVASLPDKSIWSDERDYYQLSMHIADGKGYVLENGRSTAGRPVGYPLFLATLRGMGVTSLTMIRLIQSILSTCTLLFLYLLIKIFADDRWALLTVAAGAFYPYFIYLPGTILATTWFCFLLVLAVYLLYRAVFYSSSYSMAGSGLIFGLAALAVPTGLVLIAMTLLWLVHIKTGLKQIMVFGLCGFLVLMPWLYRNIEQTGVANLSSSGGYNFWLGNNPHSQIDLPGRIEPSPELQARLTFDLSEKEIDRLYAAEATHYISQNPIPFISRTCKKAIYYWRLNPSPVTQSYVSQNLYVYWVGAISFAVMMMLALLGWVTLPFAAKPLKLLWSLYFFSFTAVHALTIVKVRFRLPLDHFILVLSAYGFIKVCEWLYQLCLKSRRSVGISRGAVFNDVITDSDWSQLFIERENIA